MYTRLSARKPSWKSCTSSLNTTPYLLRCDERRNNIARRILRVGSVCTANRCHPCYSRSISRMWQSMLPKSMSDLPFSQKPWLTLLSRHKIDEPIENRDYTQMFTWRDLHPSPASRIPIRMMADGPVIEDLESPAGPILSSSV